MKNALRTLLLTAAAAPLIAFANPSLVGTWKALPGDDMALAGELAIRKDGTATLAPQGFPALDGTWKAQGEQLTLTMPPHGSSTMDFKVEGSRLSLTYNNGAQQSFELAPANKDVK